MKIEFDFESGSASFPSAVAERVGKVSDIALRLLIILAAEPLCRQDFEAHAEQISERLRCSRKEIDMALGYWCGAGIVDISGAVTDETSDKTQPGYDGAKAIEVNGNIRGNKGDGANGGGAAVTGESADGQKKSAKLMRAAGLPDYTSEELADMLEKDGGALGFVDESQRRLGKMLNPREVSILIGLRDYLQLDENYIYVLLDYCSRIKKTSMRYIETVAFGMYDDGVVDSDALAVVLAEREAYGELEGKFKAMIGARGRRLTAKEVRFLNRWTVEMKYDFTMIGLAYEITADKQHEYNPAYMNGILERWYAAGITSPDDVEAERSKRKQSKYGNSFDTDDFFEAALRRSYTDTDT